MKHSENISHLLNPNGIYLKKGAEKNPQNVESNDSNEDHSGDSEEVIQHDETEASSLAKCNGIAMI